MEDAIMQLAEPSQIALLYMALTLLVRRGLATPRDMKLLKDVRSRASFRHKTLQKAA